MKSKIKVIIVLILVIVSLLSYNYIQDYKQDENSEIVLITVDTLRSDYIDCVNSFNQTPNICNLRNNSVSFENSYSHASYTVASMSSVMTGRYPWKIDMLNITTAQIPKNVNIIAERLQSSNYQNYGSYEIGAVSPEYGFNRGFDQYRDNSLHVNQDFYRKEPKTDKHLKLLDAAKRDQKPSFTYYHLFGPHQPFRTSEECREFSARMRDAPWKKVYDVKKEYRHNFPDRLAKKCYRESVKLADKRVGKIIQRLKENNQYNDSLIVFTADHGEGLWDNEIFGHSQTVSEELINVPLYFKFPDHFSKDHKTNRFEKGYARHIDILPTVLDQNGIDYNPSNLDGKSLVSEIKDGELDSGTVKATSKNARGMITEDYKVVETFEGRLGCENNRCNYYNLTGDNISEIQREEVPSNIIDRFVSELPEISSSTLEPNIKQESHDSDLRKRLEDLGYAVSSGDDGAGEEKSHSKEEISESESDESRTVRFTEDGFEPSEITINANEYVVWIDENEDTSMWIASDYHPSHKEYDGSSLNEHCNEQNDDAFDQCSTGNKYNFSFGKEGRWNYHNHMKPDTNGAVIVKDPDM